MARATQAGIMLDEKQLEALIRKIVRNVVREEFQRASRILTSSKNGCQRRTRLSIMICKKFVARFVLEKHAS